ncbi:MAG TPA: ATP-binding protein [Stellaceae bacterium]|nr:ATP-binding protein [Stellaceae bacterium]
MPDAQPQTPTEEPDARFVSARVQAHVDALNQRIFDTSLDLILVCDKRGTLTRVSPSAKAILGYEPAEMSGHTAREFLYPEDLDNTREEMRKARGGGEIRNFSCRYVHRDGRVVPLVWTGVWSEPEQRHFFIGRDVTERLAIEQRLRQAQRMEAIGQLTGGMAHDFNNILGVVIGSLDMLRIGGRLSQEDDELVAGAIDAAVLGADLIKRLLAFARRQQLHPQRAEINALVVGIVTILERTLGEEIPIKLDLGGGIWPARVDSAQLEAGLVNLATNARDAMPKGGVLTIRTGNRELDADYASMHNDVNPGDYAMIEVSDTGTGIPPELMGRIFEPFFTTKDPGKGTGLGLSMVFGFVKQSGGHINVYSEASVGTTFRIYLPRDRGNLPNDDRPRAVAPAVGGTETILVVEDNVAMRKVVLRQLTELGYRVLEAGAAAAALEVLAAERVALLFSDVVMAGDVNGIELARLAMGRWPELKVLLTSGFPEARVAGESMPVGLRLLSKPYRRAELARTLREILDLKSAAP